MQTITPRFVLQIPSLLSSCGEKYKRDGGYPHREDKTLSVPAHEKNYRFRTHQFLVSLLLVFVLGALVQVHKLSALDAAGREFQQTTTTDKTMFLVPFAIAKATSNLFSGSLANRFGRKRVAIVGWMFSVLAPMLAMSTVTRRTENESNEQKWNRIVASGFFLGVGQGVGWTMAIMTSVDVSGPARRGFASGMCETVGYLSVAFFAAMYAALEESKATCHWEESYKATSMRTEACIRANPEGKCGAGDDWVEECSGMCNCEGYVERPSTLLFVLAMLGLIVICILGRETGVLRISQRSGGSINAGNNNNSGRVTLPVRELETPGGGNVNDDESFNADEEEEESGTASFLQQRERGASSSSAISGDRGGEGQSTTTYSFSSTFAYTIRNPNLRLVAIAAFCCNVETGLAWGLFPIWMRDELGLSGEQRDLFSGLYSFSKGIAQFYFGQHSDQNTRATPIRWGLIGGGLSLIIASWAHVGGVTYPGLLHFGAVTLGLSTGAVYPVLAPAALDHSRDASEESATLGANRFWRDLGYVMGTPLAALADSSSPRLAFHLSGLSMIIVGAYFGFAYEENLPTSSPSEEGEGDDFARGSRQVNAIET